MPSRGAWGPDSVHSLARRSARSMNAGRAQWERSRLPTACSARAHHNDQIVSSCFRHAEAAHCVLTEGCCCNDTPRTASAGQGTQGSAASAGGSASGWMHALGSADAACKLHCTRVTSLVPQVQRQQEGPAATPRPRSALGPLQLDAAVLHSQCVKPLQQ